ncbi:MAG: S8 family serine peptidase, partial [Pirellulales bacterium]
DATVIGRAELRMTAASTTDRDATTAGRTDLDVTTEGAPLREADVTGAAPLAGLAGLRVDFPNQTTQMFVDATLYHSSGANTNIKVKNHSYGIRAPYIPTVAEVNALVTSSNAGTIHVFAGGNERCIEGFGGTCSYALDGDSNKKHLQSLQETITVAALGSNGKFANYSNWGANVWVAAPSSTSGGFRITTTDRTGGAVGTGGYNHSTNGDIDSFPDLDYNSIFGGTSAASPLVAGIMALGKQVRPNMEVRMAKHLLARTSRMIDAGDGDVHSNCLVLPACTPGWLTNAAGFKFNQNYGFGLIDADAFTLQAAQFAGVTPLTTQVIAPIGVNQTIPDANLTGISQTFSLGPGAPLEQVEVDLDVINHAYRGDIEAFLTSPSGTVSRLMYRNYFDGNGVNPNVPNFIDWTFVSNAFWGENPLGTWTLTLRDVYPAGVGTWSSYSVLAKMGTLIPVPEPASLTLAALGIMAFLFRISRRPVRFAGEPDWRFHRADQSAQIVVPRDLHFAQGPGIFGPLLDIEKFERCRCSACMSSFDQRSWRHTGAGPQRSTDAGAR